MNTSPQSAKTGWLLIIAALAVFLTGLLAGSMTPLGNGISNLLNGARGRINLATSEQIYRILRADFDGELSTVDLQDGSSAGLVRATGDQYSHYLTPSQWQAFQQRMQGNGFVGIGVELGVKNGEVVIIAPQAGSPAKEAGIQAGDVLYKIDGQPTSDMDSQEITAALRGEAGSSVTLTVIRGDEKLDISILRRPIVTPTVQSVITDDNIGILTITSFNATTAELARAAATEFAERSVMGIVLDMRDNPGGSVIAARDVIGLWVPKGSLAMTEKRGNEVLRTYETIFDPVVGDIPTVVLLNSGSASASEVVAGALRDYGKATIIGETSFGKGSVQSTRQLLNGGALSFTVSRWFTPRNVTIDGVGLSPDIYVKDAEGSDSQLLKATSMLIR